jgi:hypothetical protein
MESNLHAEVESDMRGLLPNQRGAITMLGFIIKRMVIWNQEAWDALKDYIRSVDIRNYPGMNVPTACLKLKAVVNVLSPKLPSNAVQTILERFLKASTASFTQVCATKIAMQGNSTYASFQDKIPLHKQVLSMLDDLEQKYQQLITAKKWEGVGHSGMIQGKLSFKVATIANDDNATAYVDLAKQRILYKDRAKLQKCNHCGARGHV